MRIDLPRVVRGVHIVTRTALQPGERIRCDDCGGVHVVVTCSSPKHPELLFVYCGAQMRLAALGEWAFYEPLAS